MQFLSSELSYCCGGIYKRVRVNLKPSRIQKQQYLLAYPKMLYLKKDSKLLLSLLKLDWSENLSQSSQNLALVNVAMD